MKEIATGKRLVLQHQRDGPQETVLRLIITDISYRISDNIVYIVTVNSNCINIRFHILLFVKKGVM